MKRNITRVVSCYATDNDGVLFIFDNESSSSPKRLTGYSFITEPSMCLIFEAMEAVTAALMTTSAIAYATQLSTSTTMTTVLGIINTTYYGLGESFIPSFPKKETVWLRRQNQRNRFSRCPAVTEIVFSKKKWVDLVDFVRPASMSITDVSKGGMTWSTRKRTWAPVGRPILFGGASHAKGIVMEKKMVLRLWHSQVRQGFSSSKMARRCHCLCT